MSERTVIEVNGVKMEVDLRYARRVEEIRIGDRVKVLTKSYSGHDVRPGIVIGFEPFQKLPTIIIAAIHQEYNKVEVKTYHYNADTKDVEIVHAVDDDLSVDRASLLTVFDRQISAKQLEIDALLEQRRYFETNFRAYWERIEAPKAEPEVSGRGEEF
ncbi:MAG TPA: hypothetical protein VJP88_05225 [Caulobacteraceae bacterium]|nr:hypothetical protein [Caulobacteraceae bacterium]